MAVGPASGWNGLRVLCGHVEDIIHAAGVAVETRAVAATGVGMRFAAGDDWLAARLAALALVKRVSLAQTVKEYHELVRLMEDDDCV